MQTSSNKSQPVHNHNSTKGIATSNPFEGLAGMEADVENMLEIDNSGNDRDNMGIEGSQLNNVETMQMEDTTAAVKSQTIHAKRNLSKELEGG